MMWRQCDDANRCLEFHITQDTDAFQSMSQFLILSNFTSLHYFKKFPLELPKWQSDPFIFPFSVCRVHGTSIFSPFTVMIIFLTILIAITLRSKTLDNYKYSRRQIGKCWRFNTVTRLQDFWRPLPVLGIKEWYLQNSRMVLLDLV